MAQVTESLLREFEAALDRGEKPACTDNEFRQLIFSHREVEQLRARIKRERRRHKAALWFTADDYDSMECYARILRGALNEAVLWIAKQEPTEEGYRVYRRLTKVLAGGGGISRRAGVPELDTNTRRGPADAGANPAHPTT